MRTLLCIVMTLVLASAARPLAVRAQQAQDTDADAQRTALARSLFEEGLGHVGRREWPEAADRFRRALALRPTPQLRLNLALALAEARHLVEASELLRTVESDATAPEPLRAQARGALAPLLRRIGRLTIRVSGPTDGTNVTLDGQPFAPEALGVAAPVDPGTHVVAASRAGTTVASESVEIAQGARAEVTLHVPLPRVTTPTPAPDAPPSTSSGSVFGKWWFWTIVVAALAAGTTVAVLVATSSTDATPVYGNATPGFFEIEVMP